MSKIGEVILDSVNTGYEQTIFIPTLILRLSKKI